MGKIITQQRVEELWRGGVLSICTVLNKEFIYFATEGCTCALPLDLFPPVRELIIDNDGVLWREGVIDQSNRVWFKISGGRFVNTLNEPFGLSGDEENSIDEIKGDCAVYDIRDDEGDTILVISTAPKKNDGAKDDLN